MDGERERERQIDREKERESERPFIKLHINRGALRSIADAIKLPLGLSVLYAHNNRLHEKRQRIFLNSISTMLVAVLWSGVERFAGKVIGECY